VDYKSGVEGAAIAQLAGNLRSEWAETHEKTGENRQNRKLFRRRSWTKVRQYFCL
jgi:hypothetical protein